MSESDNMDGIPPGAPEIPVLVGGCEKWVTGLTKRTTCDDVIYALLQTERNTNSSIDTQSYVVFERWRDMERPLQGRTKILKVWRAWGNEQENVTFTMRKINCVKDSREVIKSRRHRKPARDRSEKYDRRDSSSSRERNSGSRSTSKEKGQRVDRHKNAAITTASPSRLQTLEQLVQKVISQEKVIQDQMARLRDTDKEIEEHETLQHIHRVQENGENYVQDAYLKNIAEDSLEEVFQGVTPENMETYVKLLEQLVQLDDMINQEQTRIENLSYQILDESTTEAPSSESDESRWVHDRMRQGKGQSTSEVLQEANILRTALKRSISLNSSQRTEIERVNTTVNDVEMQLRLKREYLTSLMEEIEAEENLAGENFDEAFVSQDYPPNGGVYAGEVGDEFDISGGEEVISDNYYSTTHIPYVTVHTWENVSKYKNEDNDSNSDTGLSSLHSDEATPTPILETLV
ncbi:ras association domain-containing protein 10 isoform X2 [Lingula anatina]|uniref:Ras association domain-containing protein 10 isoform X2 n=1 Tax=Lingula anatina TaxID=7574 RepID=A0A1S3HL55_LINAN|nr:ras association domain-containing protein 10 isoform X2 [Lingula anatina]XP_013386839.1 ras association domain-containing protein 10 isoform X2 [Lingula anatina]XP_013386840.1 ras association domain-containing protein 10 isoform X2 [Lingula anatina]XP_013386841.1 ras association domain-containing protein 10 isoform X2 [Lingula anatina]|eukprot:XP_013386838.1 ras association domain-containing protein 10 isoform X2 [Lingula anatina]